MVPPVQLHQQEYRLPVVSAHISSAVVFLWISGLPYFQIVAE
jgi:hypothetical protein